MIPNTVVQRTAQAVDALRACQRPPVNSFGAGIHEATLTDIEKRVLPRGSGLDVGVSIDRDESTGEKLVLHTAFHHMNEGGFYDGWTQHDVIVKPSLRFGFTLSITGPDRHAIKDYLHEVFHQALGEPYTPQEQEAEK